MIIRLNSEEPSNCEVKRILEVWGWIQNIKKVFSIFVVVFHKHYKALLSLKKKVSVSYLKVGNYGNYRLVFWSGVGVVTYLI